MKAQGDTSHVAAANFIIAVSFRVASAIPRRVDWTTAKNYIFDVCHIPFAPGGLGRSTSVLSSLKHASHES